LASILLSPASADATGPSGTIETFAGGGVGDGRPGLQTHLWALSSVTADQTGRVYWVENRYANTNTLRVRMWDPLTDRVQTVAGTGMPPDLSHPWSREGEPATGVSINPAAVAATADGSLYVNSQIRGEDGFQKAVIFRVDGESGRISLVAIVPHFPYTYETDSQGRLYFGQGASIRRYDPATGQSVRIAGADCVASGVCIWPSAVFSPDGRPADGSPISLVLDIEVDPEGNVYFAEPGRIRWIDTDGILHTLAGGGATSADGAFGSQTKMDETSEDGGTSGTVPIHRLLPRADGSVWYTDGARLRSISADPEIPGVAGSRRVTTVLTMDGGFQDGPLGSARFGAIADLQEYPGGGFLVADSGKVPGPHPNGFFMPSFPRVRLVSADGQVTTIVGDGARAGDGAYRAPEPDVYEWTGDGGPANQATLSRPCGIATGPDGDIYVTETEFHDTVRRIDAETGTISPVAGTEGHGYAGDGGPATEALFQSPCGLAVAPDGDVFVADSENRVIRRIDGDTGIVTTFAGTGVRGSTGDSGPAAQATLDMPVALALAPDGSLFIADPLVHRIRKVSPDGIITTVAGTGAAGYDGDEVPAAGARLNQPRGLAFEPDGSLLIADAGNQMIRRIAPDGMIRRVAGSGQRGRSGDGGPWLSAQFDWPQGVALDPRTGTIFVADTLNQVIRALDPDGTVRHVAGTGEEEVCGDGGLAMDACLNDPAYLLVTPAGDLLVTDYSNYRVRIVYGPTS
jgi:DNA-binding beta-propeller fold protein YncE